MGRGRAKAKQTKVARELKYRSIDTDFSSLAKELRGTDEGPGVPPAYADLIEKEPEGAYSVPPDEEYEDLRRSG